MNSKSPFASLSDEQLRTLHAISESFEVELRSGKPAQIETFLGKAPMDLRTELFCELLELELEWQRSKGKSLQASDYIKRFPEFQVHIAQQLNFRAQPTISDSNRLKLRDVDSSVSGEFSAKVAKGVAIDNRYEIVELIGEGGMGSVYLAQQREPVDRRVAIKFIKGGMDSKAVQARFTVERQALALMDHPGIARVFDGGQTDGGQSYFVMEYVPGVPLTRYCDEQRLDVKARLRLFVSVCYAVQHAHNKGIIHRDLKPGNILVTEADGRPRPKVIDFGVAKAIDQKLSGQSLAATAMIVGTPAYMSPEQADPASMDIDIRTDVYALGVILYELLAGTPPHDSDGIPKRDVLEMLRVIREVDSPRPSTKVKSSISLTKIAANRCIDPQKLGPLLRGELDWIALKAIEKDRNRRYATVSDLQQDIQRYLSGEMVEARPPSGSYRLKKFVRRNQWQVVAVCLLAVSLVAGIIGTTRGMLEARKHEQAARDELTAKEAALESEAQERRFAEAIAEFVESDFLALTSLEGRLDFNEPGSPLTKDSTLRDLLDRATKKLDGRKDLDPRIEARLRSIIGKSYAYLGAFQNAVESYKRSAELNGQVFGKEHLSTIQSETGLAKAWQDNGQLDAAQAALPELVSRAKKLLGDRHEQTLDCMGVLATNYRKTGEPQKAIVILEETLEQQTALHGPNAQVVLTNMYRLALARNEADQPDKAIALLEQTLTLQTRHLGAEHPDVNASATKVAELYCKFGRFQEAKPLLEKGLEWSIANYGTEDHNTIYNMARLVKLYRDLGELERAVPMAERNLELAKKVFGDQHPNVANALSDLAVTYRAAGEHAKALPLFEESMERRKASNGVKHPGTIISVLNFASSLKANGDAEQAQELNQECLAIAVEVLGESHSTTMTIKQNLAIGYWTTKKFELSIPIFEELLKLREEKLGRKHPETMMTVANLGTNYRDAGRLDEAIPLLEEAYAAIENLPSLKFVEVETLDGWLQAGNAEKADALLSKLVADARAAHADASLGLSNPLATLGRVLLRTKRFDDAQPLLREALEIRKIHEPDKWRTWDTSAMLGELMLKKQEYAEAESLLVAALEGMERDSTATQKDRKVRRNEVVGVLIELLKSLGRNEEAVTWKADNS